MHVGETPNREVKRGLYLRYQRLFEIDCKKLAGIILDNIEALKCPLPMGELYGSFRRKCKEGSSFAGLGAFRSAGTAENSAFKKMISSKEVLKNIAEMNKNSTPGPDDLSLRDVIKKDPQGSQLAELFNLWLLARRIPYRIKECRMILIPKSDDPSKIEDMNNWRPITIGSVILRLFSRILTARLRRACLSNSCQRGFTAAPSCAENLKLLQVLIRHHKTLAVVFVDLAKAFDSVNHHHILEVVREKSIDGHILDIIADTYNNCATRLEVGETCSEKVEILTRVKQGDPMSPLLFNLAVDSLLCKLEEIKEGFKHGNSSVSSLAFVDDLVLLSDSWDGMQKSIQVVEEFCHTTGLKV
uniref:Reverse transcriptase domain-containing protein n=1 Tax=Apteryx owenii TaxID=8824 RepID=A0A8B9QGS0_APTOW